MDVTQWRFARSEPDAIFCPTGSAFDALEWMDAVGPGTAASMLRDRGRWVLGDDLDFDAFDWWFRAPVEQVGCGAGWLQFDGLATVAEVWFDGRPVLTSENMFREHRVPVSFASGSEVVIACRSLARHLTCRRPRPKWKTRLVADQQLRWVRTTLLGRMPGWSPGPAAVGPWRSVRATLADQIELVRWEVRTRVIDAGGAVDVSFGIESPAAVRSVDVAVAEKTAALRPTELVGQWTGTVVVDAPRRWYPHTHGDPARYPVTVAVTTVDGLVTTFEQPAVGFRELDPAPWADDKLIRMNGVDIFARGVCWVPPDPVRMSSDEVTLRAAVAQVVDAGLNIIRVPGTTAYEQPMFHELCDELGVMVWQDFMFANMQYPIDDAEFAATVAAEATAQSTRVAASPSTVVLCGGSEVEQQAAMMGAPASVTDGHRLGSVLLRDISTALAPGVHYVDNSPSGGVVPFSVGEGVAHYFGVGAYLRPMEEVRHAGVRFASECLAFANVPDRSSVDAIAAGGRAPHAPAWKAGVPRDGGAGWDFDDVHDVYCERLFGLDPLAVRYSDPDRYLELARATSSWVIERTVTEWRRRENRCNGAIVLQLRDVLAGAGWGVIDVSGHPKSAFYGLRRASRPVALHLCDDGLDGLTSVVHNDTATDFSGTLTLRALGRRDEVEEAASIDVELHARSSVEIAAATLFDEFKDLTYTYRFGPLRHDVVVGELRDPAQSLVRTAHFFPGGLARPVLEGEVLRAEVHAVDGGVQVGVTTTGCAEFVSIDLAGYVAEDNWFHLEPGGSREVFCRPTGEPVRSVSGEVRAVNVAEPVFVRVAQGGSR